jgi:hypothetical protein
MSSNHQPSEKGHWKEKFRIHFAGFNLIEIEIDLRSKGI